MSHWAEIDENNIVIRVTVGSNDDVDEGYSWLQENLGGQWIKTSYNNKIRKRFAAIGHIYNAELDMFILPKCHNEAVLNEFGDWICGNGEHDG